MGLFDSLRSADINAGVREFRETPGAKLIDVRTPAEFADGHIPGAVNVPLVVPDDGSMFTDEAIVDAIEAAGVEPSDDVVLYCQTGYHAGLAAEMLVGEGFADIELYDGSMDDWSAQQLPIER